MCAAATLGARAQPVRVLQWLLSVLLCINLLLEAYLLTRILVRKTETLNLCRAARYLCLGVMLWGVTQQDWQLGVRSTVVWEFGVAAMLMTMFGLACSLNSIPGFTVFMPLSTEFVVQFFKLVIYIFLTILSFSICFHFLLTDQAPFNTMWYSTVKTLVWMLGDLGYDDTFLNEDSPVKYPILTNILFIFFVTVIAWLIFNLILTNPSDSLEKVREKACFYRVNAVVKMYLWIDDCAPSLRRKFTIEKLEVRKKPSWQLMSGRQHYSSSPDGAQATTAQEEPANNDEMNAKLNLLIAKIDNLYEQLGVPNSQSSN